MVAPLLISLVGVGLAVLFTAILFRRVVKTDEVHIVQSAKKTIPYGKDTKNGNVYYDWPSWVPIIGISVRQFPVSVFDLELNNYAAYDVGRVPFLVDIRAFFRISDPEMAAERIESFQELKNQLIAMLEGAARTILASNEIEEILQGRSKFGEEFTNEVTEHLKSWGVDAVKSIELMDIRDTPNGKVIRDIMQKKMSLVEMQSRMEVAENNRQAENKEIEAKRDVDLQAQQAREAVGIREAEADKAIGVSKEKSLQEIKEEAKITAEKDMAVKQVEIVKQAEITKEEEIIRAEQEKETTIRIATGNMEQEKLRATGIQSVGEAEATAERMMNEAKIAGDVKLAKDLGENQPYLAYLAEMRSIEAKEAIGKEQAKALIEADLKVIANTGDAKTGVDSLMDLFSPKGGTALGGSLEGLAQTPMGKSLLEKFGISDIKDAAPSKQGISPVEDFKKDAPEKVKGDE